MNYILSIVPDYSTWSLTQILIYVVAVVGAILLTYSVFLEAERRQDLVCIIGSLCMLPYAIWINNLIFILAMAGIAIASAIEFAEIIMGKHKDVGAITEDIKNPKGKMYQ